MSGPSFSVLMDCFPSSHMQFYFLPILFSRADDKNTAMQSKTGVLTTPLTEDVFYLIEMQRHFLHEHLVTNELLETSKGDDMLVEGLLCVMSCLKEAQAFHRPLFVGTLEECCAASNDFFRMSECMDDVLTNLLETYPLLVEAVEESQAAAVRREASELVSIFTRDSVYAAERTHVFTMQAVDQSKLAIDLFGVRWENEWTNNELAVDLAKSFDRDLVDIKSFLCEDFLYHKAVVVAAKAMVCFYVKCLIEKAHHVRRLRQVHNRIVKYGEQDAFCDHERALLRMKGDVVILRNCMLEKVEERSVPWYNIAKELSFLELIHSCVGAKDLELLEVFVADIHERTGADANVTRYFLGDLWQLTENLHGKRHLYKTIEALAHTDPKDSVASNEAHESMVVPVAHSKEVSLVSLVDMLREIYKNRMSVAARVVPACRSVQAEGKRLVARQMEALRRHVPDLRRGGEGGEGTKGEQRVVA